MAQATDLGCLFIFGAQAPSSMRWTTSIILSALATATFAQPVPNPGFEQWVDGQPVGWSTNNSSIVGNTITMVSPGHGGAHALRGTSVQFAQNVIGPFLSSSAAGQPPFPIAQAYSVLRFHYRLGLLSDAGVEVLSVSVLITDAQGNGIGAGVLSLTAVDNTSSWTLAEVPIIYSGTGPAGAALTFLIGGTGNAVGSFFELDDVELGFATGIGDAAPELRWSAPYPQPAQHAVELPFVLERSTAVRLLVLDALGRTTTTRNLGVLVPGRHVEQLAVEGWAPGLYQAVLETDAARLSVPLLVGR